jgi:hypothetical protein
MRNTNTNKTTKTKTKKTEKQTKDADTGKGRDERQTRLMNAWTLLREFCPGLPGMLLRSSERGSVVETSL